MVWFNEGRGVKKRKAREFGEARNGIEGRGKGGLLKQHFKN